MINSVGWGRGDGWMLWKIYGPEKEYYTHTHTHTHKTQSEKLRRFCRPLGKDYYINLFVFIRLSVRMEYP